jgi:hypothetical protein
MFCGRSFAEIVGSNPAWAINVSLLWMLCVLSGTGLCDGPIPHPEESYGLRSIWELPGAAVTLYTCSG